MPDRHIVDASLTGPSPRLTGVMDIVITPMWGWTCRTACRLDELPSRRPLVAPTNGVPQCSDGGRTSRNETV
jgi:hypothetical protein